MTARAIRLSAGLIALCAVSAFAQTRGGAPPGRTGGPPTAPPAPRAAALADFTGQWVSLVTEDWRYRMFTAPKGDTMSLPLSPAGQKTAASWDRTRDEAAGEQCRAFGAGGIMRMPTRLRIAWTDDSTLKIETDAGAQTRLLGFGTGSGEPGSWQGVSIAAWDYPRAAFAARGFIPGAADGRPASGSLKVITTQMRAGYLRRNGVPYSAKAVMTEHFERLEVPGGDTLLVIAAEINDPEYLAAPYWTSTQFKRQQDGRGWNPTPCASR